VIRLILNHHSKKATIPGNAKAILMDRIVPYSVANSMKDAKKLGVFLILFTPIFKRGIVKVQFAKLNSRPRLNRLL